MLLLLIISKFSFYLLTMTMNDIVVVNIIVDVNVIDNWDVVDCLDYF